jgi:HlyD family secretion protein
MTKKRIIIFLVVVVLVGAGVAFATTRSQASTSTTQTELGQVTQATLTSVVESSGSVIPKSKITLAFGTSGAVTKVNVQVGDQVKKGDVLAELDTTDLELAIAQAEQEYLNVQATYSMTVNSDPDSVKAAELAVSNAAAAYQLAQQKYAVNKTDQVMISCNNLDNAKKTYDDAVNAYNAYVANWRVQVNGTADISPQKSQLDRAKAAYEQAVANCNLTKSSINTSGVQSAYASLVQAKANLEALKNPSERTLLNAAADVNDAKLAYEQALQDLENAKIVAPFDGVVTTVGPVVGAQAGGNTTIKLADNTQYHVDVLVDEAEIAQVKTGQQVKVTFDALTDVSTTGTVTRISPAGTVSNGVVNYTVRVDLEPVTATLRNDMTSSVSVVVGTHANVLAVPGGAIRSGSEGGYYVNVVQADGTARQVPVTTGYTDGTLTEVAGEIQAGQQVYISEPTITTTTQQRGLNLFGMRIGG